eukprot:tig00021332_g20325.t1
MAYCKDIYNKACTRLGVRPEASYYRHLLEPSFEAYSIEDAEAEVGQNELRALVLSVAVQHSLKSLSLARVGSKAFTVEVAKDLVKAMSTNKSITELDLSCNNMGDKAGVELASMLLQNKTLLSLNLSRNMLNRKSGEALANSLCQSSSLLSLDISQNPMQEHDSLGAVIGNALSTNTGLINLVLNLREPGATALVDRLEYNGTLATLSLTHNELASGGHRFAQSLERYLATNTSLTSLQLAHAYLGPEAGRILGGVLRRSRSLISVGLRYNALGTEGALALSDALHHNFTLTDLHLGHNELSDRAASSLAQALHVNRTLTALRLSDNPIGPEGGAALLKAAEANYALLYMGNLESVPIGVTLRAAIERALSKNRAESDLAATIAPTKAEAVYAEGGPAAREELRKLRLRVAHLEELCEKLHYDNSRLLRERAERDALIAEQAEQLRRVQEEAPYPTRRNSVTFAEDGARTRRRSVSPERRGPASAPRSAPSRQR